jgi:uncharacterized protein YybS (DUF2232 family)
MMRPSDWAVTMTLAVTTSIAGFCLLVYILHAEGWAWPAKVLIAVLGLNGMAYFVLLRWIDRRDGIGNGRTTP